MNKKIVREISILALVMCICIGLICIRTLVYPVKYYKEIKGYSFKYDLDPYLVMAFINVESKYNKNASSSKNACGLMQITYNTAQEVNTYTKSTYVVDEESLYDIDVNLDIGCHYLASLITKYNGNYYLAVCAYNAGMGNVDKWIETGKIPNDLNTTDVELPFLETQNYLQKIIENYENYKKKYPNINK